jgi:hypothetical protein
VGAASGWGAGRRARGVLCLRGGVSCGSVSVARIGRLDSGRSVNSEGGSPAVPGAAGIVIARLVFALLFAAAGGVALGRIAW